MSDVVIFTNDRCAGTPMCVCEHVYDIHVSTCCVLRTSAHVCCVLRKCAVCCVHVLTCAVCCKHACSVPGACLDPSPLTGAPPPCAALGASPPSRLSQTSWPGCPTRSSTSTAAMSTSPSRTRATARCGSSPTCKRRSATPKGAVGSSGMPCWVRGGGSLVDSPLVSCRRGPHLHGTGDRLARHACSHPSMFIQGATASPRQHGLNTPPKSYQIPVPFMVKSNHKCARARSRSWDESTKYPHVCVHPYAHVGYCAPIRTRRLLCTRLSNGACLLPPRYIMEDRFSAIRAAIGTAAENDVVLIAGRGHGDCMEYWDGEEGIVKVSHVCLFPAGFHPSHTTCTTCDVLLRFLGSLFLLSAACPHIYTRLSIGLDDGMQACKMFAPPRSCSSPRHAPCQCRAGLTTGLRRAVRCRSSASCSSWMASSIARSCRGARHLTKWTPSLQHEAF